MVWARSILRPCYRFSLSCAPALNEQKNGDINEKMEHEINQKLFEKESKQRIFCPPYQLADE
jgi:hypothetical protein